MTVEKAKISSSAAPKYRSFLHQWHQNGLPKQISLHAPKICAVCGSPEITCMDRVYHRNMNFPRIEWISYLAVHVCTRHQGTWKIRMWSSLLLGISGLLCGIYFAYLNAYVGYSIIGMCVGIIFILVYWRDPAARMIRIESFSGFFLIEPQNPEWARQFVLENSSEIREIPDVLKGYRRNRKILFLICGATIIGILISLTVVLPLWSLPTYELLQHPEIIGGILGLVISGILLCLLLTFGLDRLMREKENLFQRMLRTSSQTMGESVKEKKYNP